MSNDVTRTDRQRNVQLGLDPIVLHDAVALLAGSEDARCREFAARQLLHQLRQLAHARAITHLLSKPGYRACGDDLIEDAIQQTAIAVWSGEARFRGSSPPAAVAWCLGILKNYARAEVRRRAPRQRETSLGQAASHSEGAEYEGVLWHAAAQEAQVILGSLDDQVRTYLRRTRSRRAAESLYQAVHSYVTEVAGGRNSGSPAVRKVRTVDADEQKKARDRAYQHHHRARCVLAEMLDAYDSADVGRRSSEP
jgi:DNA-directed RNA polymerase specialized sigma24 family protein